MKVYSATTWVGDTLHVRAANGMMLNASGSHMEKRVDRVRAWATEKFGAGVEVQHLGAFGNITEAERAVLAAIEGA